jgi:hypothetical protein
VTLKQVWLVLISVLLVPSSCYTANQSYDPALSCSTGADCTGAVGTPVCDVGGTMTCVQCTAAESGECKDQSPVCGGDQKCRGCTAHTECASAACLPDGSCAREGEVAYVAPTPTGSNNTMCTKAMPCVEAGKALQTNRAYVKFSGSTDELVVVDDRNVTFLADPNGKLMPTKNGIVLEVKGTSKLEIYDLEITGGSGGAGGIGISMPPGNSATLKLIRAKVTNNTGGGIVASGGTLTVTQSTVSGNTAGGISASGGTLTVTQSTVSGNTAGGISASGGSFSISNNVIAKNGGLMSPFGGVYLNQITTAGNKFEFNTVSGNGSMGLTTGVVCALVGQPVAMSNNIVYGNQGTGIDTQVAGANCNWTYSDIGPDTVAGTGNLSVDPGFVDPAANNFHLKGTSVAKDAANPAATLEVDIDGDARPQGPRRDMGADEVKP